MENEIKYASKSKRIGSVIVDLMFIIVIWYLMTKSDLNKVNELMKTLDPNVSGSLDVFATAIIKLVIAFVFKFIFVNTLYYCFIPALIGEGRTIGKYLFKLRMVDATTFEEIPALRLILREFVGRGLVEILLMAPLLLSAIIVLFSNKGITIHDMIAKTVVVME